MAGHDPIRDQFLVTSMSRPWHDNDTCKDFVWQVSCHERALAQRRESFFVMWCLSLLPFRLVSFSLVSCFICSKYRTDIPCTCTGQRAQSRKRCGLPANLTFRT